MVFKSDKQRKKVMALLKGGTKSDVSPQIIPIKIFSILPNKKGKVVVKNLRTGEEQTIKEHLNNLKQVQKEITRGREIKKLFKKQFKKP